VAVFFEVFLPPPPPMVQLALVGKVVLISEASCSHSDTPQSVGFLWTSDEPVSETSTWQQTTLTKDRHPCIWRYSNPQSQLSRGRRPMP